MFAHVSVHVCVVGILVPIEERLTKTLMAKESQLQLLQLQCDNAEGELAKLHNTIDLLTSQLQKHRQARVQLTEVRKRAWLPTSAVEARCLIGPAWCLCVENGERCACPGDGREATRRGARGMPCPYSPNVPSGISPP